MKHLLLSSLLTVALTSNAQLYIKNNSERTYKVSIAMFVSQFRYSGWISQGWYELAPGEEKEILASLPRERYVYYCAIGTQDTINGYKKILVNPNLQEEYKVVHAILTKTKEENPTLEWYKFREVRRPGLFIKRKKLFRIVLGE